jgi:Ser/Thr protein kinase RdoA (MazF antagonist)
MNIEKALEPWGGDLRVETRVGSGIRSETFLVSYGGERCSVRVSRQSPAALDWEMDLLEFLSEHGIRVHLPVRTQDGCRHVNGVVMFTWIEGRPPEAHRDWLAVTRVLEEVHELTTEWSQRPGFSSTTELMDTDRGGNVDLTAIPTEVAELCRTAWRVLEGWPTSVVHGDPGTDNILIGQGISLIDWDEARVDASVLDLVEIPRWQMDSLIDNELLALKAASDAWEVACSWELEPDYARRRLRSLVERIEELKLESD